MNVLSSITINTDIYISIIDQVSKKIKNQEPGITILSGAFGTGKTTVLRKVCNHYKKEGQIIDWIDGRSIFNAEVLLSMLSSAQSCIIFIDDIDFFYSRVDTSEKQRLMDSIKINKSILVGASDNLNVIQSSLSYILPIDFISIPPLDMESLWEVLLSDEQKKRAQYLGEFLTPTIRHAEEIYGIVKGRRGYDLLQLIERHSALYCERYRKLSIYSQNILNNLAEDHTGLTMSELKQRTNLPNNILSSYLRTLRNNDIISYEVRTKGKTKYKICDLLFRKWLISESLSKF